MHSYGCPDTWIGWLSFGRDHWQVHVMPSGYIPESGPACQPIACWSHVGIDIYICMYCTSLHESVHTCIIHMWSPIAPAMQTEDVSWAPRQGQRLPFPFVGWLGMGKPPSKKRETHMCGEIPNQPARKKKNPLHLHPSFPRM